MLQVVLLKIQRLFLCVASAVLFVGFLARQGVFLPAILTGWLADWLGPQMRQELGLC